MTTVSHKMYPTSPQSSFQSVNFWSKVLADYFRIVNVIYTYLTTWNKSKGLRIMMKRRLGLPSINFPFDLPRKEQRVFRRLSSLLPIPLLFPSSWRLNTTFFILFEASFLLLLLLLFFDHFLSILNGDNSRSARTVGGELLTTACSRALTHLSLTARITADADADADRRTE